MKTFTEIEENIVMRDRWIFTYFRTSTNELCGSYSKKSISFYENRLNQYPPNWVEAVSIVLSLRNS